MSPGEAEELFDELLTKTDDFEFTMRRYPVLNPTSLGEADLKRDQW